MLASDVGPADAGELEQVRRADRAGGEHDLAIGARLDGRAAARVAHADRAPPLEDEALDMGVGDERADWARSRTGFRKPRAALQRRPRRWLTSK